MARARRKPPRTAKEQRQLSRILAGIHEHMLRQARGGPEPDELAESTADLFKTHPDHGGSNDAFRKAFARYRKVKAARRTSK